VAPFRTQQTRKDRKVRRALPGNARWWTVAGMAGVVGLGGFLGAREPEGGAESAVSALVAAAGSQEAIELAVSPLDANELGVSKEWDLPNLDHHRVSYWVDRFQHDPDMHEKFEGFLRRSGWYREMIARQLAERGMPQDLLYLAMIESGFQPRAYSPAAASGLWQFIGETGRRYGLTVDSHVDERNHPERATEAALDYLQDLHDRFDSWYLAAAAYNTGENRVGRIMREEFGSEKAFGEGTYYRIWDRLPRETRDYVPLMIAAARITKDPARYGFGDVQPENPLTYDEVVTDAGLTFQQIASAAGVEVDDVKLLNPHLKNGRAPANRRVALRLPEGTAKSFQENWSRYVGRPSMTVRTASAAPAASGYRVRNGDNLGAIAQRHGMTVAQLRRLNGLRSDRIYAGQSLRVE
jgi:membrane-bound lytic murein transglycosylase D